MRIRALENALESHLNSRGWLTGGAVPVGAPSVFHLVTGRKDDDLVAFLPKEGGRSTIKLDADEVYDLKEWARTNDVPVFIAVLFGDGWLFKDVTRLSSNWIRRTDVADRIG